MKFKEFLIESELGDMINVLKTECSDYLKTHQKLYRGHSNTSDFLEINNPINRKPMNNVIETQKFLDEGFKSVFGYKLRETSTFITGNKNEALEYGELYVVFPKNKYKIFWSNEILDLYALNYKNFDLKDENILNFFIIFNYLNKNMIDYQYLIKKSNIDNIDDFIKNKSKFCCEYFIKKFYKTNDVEKAIKSSNEIMLIGDCYLIKYNFYKQYLEKFLI